MPEDMSDNLKPNHHPDEPDESELIHERKP
jgi:hypothetical protein